CGGTTGTVRGAPDGRVGGRAGVHLSLHRDGRVVGGCRGGGRRYRSAGGHRASRRLRGTLSRGWFPRIVCRGAGVERTNASCNSTCCPDGYARGGGVCGIAVPVPRAG